MGKRGRPPYPDILTPREWEVLCLLRDRLSNEQIAAHLGISIDGAKYHVSEILSKLAVRTREEAAAWRSIEERPWWMRLIALPAAAKIASVLALVGAAGVAGALFVASTGGEEEVVPQAEETAAADDIPEGWALFSHPGTQEAPPFSFAHPGEWHMRGPELVPVDTARGDPLGTAVRVELFSYDPAFPPSQPPPGNWMHLKVFVGPYAPLEVCMPPEIGDRVLLDGLDARRMVLTRAPGATSEAISVSAVTPDDCYALDTSFSIDGQWEETFDRIVDSFRVDEGARVASPTPGPLTPVRASPGSDVGVSPAPTPEGFDTYVHPGSPNAPPFSFAYPAYWSVGGSEAPEGSNGFYLQLTPSTNPAPQPGAGEIPANWVNVDIGVLPTGVTGQCTVQGHAQPAVLGSKAGWGFEGRPWDNVIARDVRAEHAGFCFWVSGWFSEPADPKVFDRITESFRFAE